MAPAEQLRRRWLEIVGALPARGNACQSELAALLQAYAGPGRHYHDTHHIAALLELSNVHRPALGDPAAVDLAIFYHDAVYEPARGDNEESSAAHARTSLEVLGLPESTIEKVVRYVLATKHVGAASPNLQPADSDLDHLLDFDLSVLAAEPAAYDAYAAAIRREYSIYADADYRSGRARVLEKLLALPALYRVPALAADWEPRARANLQRELTALGAS